MNAEMAHTKCPTVDRLREKFHEAVEFTARTGVVPAAFAGDPTFENAVCKCRKAAENADRASSA